MAVTKVLKNLPEWNLGDLYSGPDSAGFKADLLMAEKLAGEFATAYRGKVTGLDGVGLAKAISAYEQLSDLGWCYISHDRFKCEEHNHEWCHQRCYQLIHTRQLNHNC